MWIADQWKDYEVIDCSKGEKLERWGQYTLVRPEMCIRDRYHGKCPDRPEESVRRSCRLLPDHSSG